MIIYWPWSLGVGLTIQSRINKYQDSSFSKTEVMFAVEPEKLDFINQDEKSNWYACDPCESEKQIACTYNPNWNDWLIQKMSDTFANKKILENISSSNLPRLHKSYLLNLSSHKNFYEHEVDLNEAKIDSVSESINIVVFEHEKNTETCSVSDRKVYISSVEGGIYYYTFWAQLIQMFVDNSYYR